MVRRLVMSTPTQVMMNLEHHLGGRVLDGTFLDLALLRFTSLKSSQPGVQVLARCPALAEGIEVDIVIHALVAKPLTGPQLELPRFTPVKLCELTAHVTPGRTGFAFSCAAVVA